MKTANILRCLDLCGQVFMLYPLLPDKPISTSCVLTACMLVSGWQVISFLLHALCSPAARHRRRNYGIVLALVGAAILIVSLIPSSTSQTNVAALAILCGALAVWYFVLGLSELVHLYQASEHRREIHWKL